MDNKISTKLTNTVDTSTLYLTDIKNRIKNKLSSNLRAYLLFAIPIIILLCYFIYKYKFNSRTLQALSSMDYKKSLQLEKLPNCYELDPSMQYKLCDYYISSSYMTPCVGNQHYDYLSMDIITEVLQSGARYIQIPICEADISPQAIPVIATAQYGQKIITSLNTLDVRATFNIIRSNAFKLNNKAINYPLIIHLILNTNNAYTLAQLGLVIKDTIADLLVDVSKYQQYPIFLEKLCNLLNKIIIFATPEYQGTQLEPFIVPTKNMFETYHYSELNTISLPTNAAYTNAAYTNAAYTNAAYTNDYNNKLSSKQQELANQKFKQKYPSLDYVIKNSDSIGATILKDKDILNNLTQFNKVGMTLVKPHNPADVLSSNYDPADAVYFGCQFIAMNFQINTNDNNGNNNMKSYLKIFEKSSFQLKPGSMRFSEAEEPTPDLLAIYQSVIPKNTNIINDIYYKYNNLLIALEPYSLPNTYLTQSERNLRFTVGSIAKRDKFGNKTYKIGIDQCFIINKSTVSTGGDDIPVFLEAATKADYLITLTGNYFDLEEKAKNKAELTKQSMYFEKSRVSISNTAEDNLVSIRNIDMNNTMYIAYENKQVKAYPNTPQIQAQNNTAFIIHAIPFKIQVRLITLFDGSVKTMSGNILGVLENNTTDGTAYILEAVNKSPSRMNGKNFNYSKDQFYMKNPATNMYVVYDNNTFFLYDKAPTPNTNSIFNFAMSNGFYTLVNNAGQNLVLYQNNLLKFVNPEQVNSNENLFKIDLQYILV
jgi:hypothetical protein